MTEEELRNLAALAYAAYSVTTGGKSAITGDKLPPFEGTPELVKRAWIEAVAAVVQEIETWQGLS